MNLKIHKNNKKEDTGALVKRILEGDSSAFDELYNITFKDVYFHAVNVTDNASDAEDIVQETYIAAWNSLDTLKSPESVGPWLNSIATRRALNLVQSRSKKNTESLDDDEKPIDVADENEMPEEIAMREATQEIIRSLVNELPEAQRAAVMLFYYDNLSVKEVAELTDTDENTVKSRLRYARAKLSVAVQAEEKRSGIKLYSVSPLAIMLALQNLRNIVDVSPAVQISIGEAVRAACSITGAAAVGTAAATASSGSKAGLLAIIKTKITAKAAAAAAAAIVGTGVVTGAVIAINHNDGLNAYRDVVSSLRGMTQEQVELLQADYSALGSVSGSESVDCLAAAIGYDSLNNLGYALYDCNADGKPELFLGEEGSETALAVCGLSLNEDGTPVIVGPSSKETYKGTWTPKLGKTGIIALDCGIAVCVPDNAALGGDFILLLGQNGEQEAMIIYRDGAWYRTDGSGQTLTPDEETAFADELTAHAVSLNYISIHDDTSMKWSSR